MDESNKQPHIIFIEEEVETISLSNFPINSNSDTLSDDRRRSSSSDDPPEVFEFLSNFTSSEISHAEEMIFCGKVMCLKGEVAQGRRCESRSTRSSSLCSSSSSSSSSSGSSNYKPMRWYAALMFGHLKFPPVMDLHDIKNRQLRRRTTVTPIPKSSSDWDFIKMLSCKDHASVDVNTPRRFIACSTN